MIGLLYDKAPIPLHTLTLCIAIRGVTIHGAEVASYIEIWHYTLLTPYQHYERTGVYDAIGAYYMRV